MTSRVPTVPFWGYHASLSLTVILVSVFSRDWGSKSVEVKSKWHRVSCGVEHTEAMGCLWAVSWIICAPLPKSGVCVGETILISNHRLTVLGKPCCCF